MKAVDQQNYDMGQVRFLRSLESKKFLLDFVNEVFGVESQMMKVSFRKINLISIIPGLGELG